MINKIYFAYGMNTNKNEMFTRCPKAIYLQNYDLKGYKFVFRTVADIEKVEDKSVCVSGALWVITKECEKSLDLLEGYPSLYTKEYFLYKNFKIMYYIMTNKSKKRKPLADPSNYYLNSLLEGYKEHKLPVDQLNRALQIVWF